MRPELDLYICCVSATPNVGVRVNESGPGSVLRFRSPNPSRPYILSPCELRPDAQAGYAPCFGTKVVCGEKRPTLKGGHFVMVVSQ